MVFAQSVPNVSLAGEAMIFLQPVLLQCCDEILSEQAEK